MGLVGRDCRDGVGLAYECGGEALVQVGPEVCGSEGS